MFSLSKHVPVLKVKANMATFSHPTTMMMSMRPPMAMITFPFRSHLLLRGEIWRGYSSSPRWRVGPISMLNGQCRIPSNSSTTSGFTCRHHNDAAALFRRTSHLEGGTGRKLELHDKLNKPLYNSHFRFGESRHHDENFLHGSSLLFLPLLFLLFAGDDGAEDGWEGEKVTEEQEAGPGLLSSILWPFKSLFVVEAAKPLDDKDGILSKSGSKDPPLSRRKHFNFIADVLDQVQGAVVCIEVKDHSTVNWFGMPQTSSNGSGFIVKEDGLILTNAHVVATQQRCSISVKLKDGRSFAGYVEDVDYESDLATVRVKARGLPTLQLGCSSETRMGEWVVAVGSPLNLSNTVTAGIVSSTSRGATELGIHVNDINYIQTDAAITFGNSGGPLINLDCEVIGINSMKVTPGISFAIPIDHAKKFLEKAECRRTTGKSKLSRRYMGLSILSLTDEIRRELELRTGMSVVSQGVFVWQVVRGGPAFLAGLQPGDVITNINGQEMRSAAQVHEIIKTDDKLVVQVQRGDRVETFTVVPENIN